MLINTEIFIKKAENIHNDRYDYRLVNYKNNRNKIKIICKEHGIFEQLPTNHLKGSGCFKCFKEKHIKNKKYYDENIRKKDEGFCLECGKKTEYLSPNNGYREFCSIKCSNKNKNKIKKQQETCLKNYGVLNPTQSEKIKQKQKNTCLKNYGVEYNFQRKEFKEKLLNKKIEIKKEYLLEKFSLSAVSLIDRYNYKIICNKCNKIFYIHNKTLKSRIKAKHEICTNCNPLMSTKKGRKSIIEVELLDFIKENYKESILLNKRNIIMPYELDIYLPDIDLAIELNGIYWHNELYKNKKCHYEKTKLCEILNIHLIHIYEDAWTYKKKIVKSRILNLLNKNKDIIFARKCKIKDVSYNDAKEFLNNNHLQGNCVSKIRLGLYNNDKLVSLMTFGKPRLNLNSVTKKENIYELIRFTNKINTSVVGGASKLFKYFINIYKPEEIISYADRSWTSKIKSSLYEKLGFIFQKETTPNYYYVINEKRENRFKYRKDILVKEGYDKNKTEHQIMLDRKIYRIYDSGQLKFKWKIMEL